MVCLVDEGHEDLGFVFDGAVDGAVGCAVKFHASHHGFGQWGVGLPVAGVEGEDFWGGCEVFHEDGGEFGEVGCAAGAGDGLQASLAEDGVQGVAHFVEEGAHAVLAEKSGVAACAGGFGEITDQRDGGELTEGFGGWVDGCSHAVVGVVRGVG